VKIARNILEKRIRMINLLAEDINEMYIDTELSIEDKYRETIYFLNEMFRSATGLADSVEIPGSFDSDEDVIIVTDNGMDRKLKVIEETIKAMQEIHQVPLPGGDKCKKIAFLAKKMLDIIIEK
jgi:hypothetical protein